MFVGKLNFLARLRADLLYPAKELSRHVSKPQYQHWVRMKKVARYMAGTADMEVEFKVGMQNVNSLRVYSDSDHAGEKESRKSSTCVAAYLGNCLVFAMAKTQATVATSSAEAETYALGAAWAEGLHLQTLLSDLNVEVRLDLYTDNSVAQRTATRRGPGGMKHV